MDAIRNFWGRLTPLHRGLGLFLVANGLLLNLLLAALPWTRNHITALHHSGAFLIGYTNDDSWGPMAAAFDEYRGAPEVPLYPRVFFEHRIKFIYPPSSLLLHAGFAALGIDGPDRLRILVALSWLSVVLTALLVARLLLRSERRELGAATVGDAPNFYVGGALAAAYTLSFFPVVYAFTVGQIQAWLTCMAIGMLLAWEQGMPALAGALAGAVCLVKPQYALLLAWGVVRRQWRFVAASLIPLVVGLFVSIWVFGWVNHLDYLSVLTYIARHGESYFANQSMNGFLHRLVADSSHVDFEHQYATYNPWVFWGTLLSSAGFVGLALFWRAGESKQAPTTDLLIMSLTLTLASPVAWEHHYGPLIATFAIILPKLVRHPVFGDKTPVYVAVSYVLLSNLFRLTDYTAPTWFNFLQSYDLIGALMVLVALYCLRHAEAAARLA
ncbi:MAG: DUF2029 domain-containing protein [Deltaproteobacteria bacterium]|nr:DUF2029 domain-containing protein [Deltaproteobacteria bacterium]